jgi:hypothetical protein
MQLLAVAKSSYVSFRAFSPFAFGSVALERAYQDYLSNTLYRTNQCYCCYVLLVSGMLLYNKQAFNLCASPQ